MEPGEIIRRRREELGWSQTQLGNDHVGISQPRSRRSRPATATIQVPAEDPRRCWRSALRSRCCAHRRWRGVCPPPRPCNERDFRCASAEAAQGQIIVSHDAVDFMARPAPLIHVRDYPGLLITGTSGGPEYRQGDTALVCDPHPAGDPERGLHLLCEEAGEARATIKYLRRATGD